MPRALSSEILKNVISFVHGDVRSDTRSNLANCTLVSRTFCNIVKPFRFSNLTIEVIDPDDEVQVMLHLFMESALPLKNSSCTGIVQHVRCFELVLNLWSDYGEVIRTEELDEDLSGVINRFNTSHSRVHTFTLKAVERRMGWEWMGQPPRDALQQLIRSPHLRVLRLENIAKVPASLFGGTAFEELYLDTKIAEYTPKQGGEDESDSENEGEEDEDGEEGEVKQENDSVPSAAQIIPSLPLSRLATLGLKLKSEKDVIQTNAFLTAVPSLRSLELTIDETFPFKSCPELSKVKSLQQLIISNDKSEKDAVEALLACANDAIKLLQLGEGSIPLEIPTLTLKTSFNIFGKRASNGKPSPKVDSNPLDEVLAKGVFSKIQHFGFSVSVRAWGQREERSLDWLEEIRAEASTRGSFPLTYATGKTITSEVRFFNLDS